MGATGDLQTRFAGRIHFMQTAEIEDPIPISALQHAIYCLRQAALIHIERVWAENRFTAEGRVLHETTDEPGARQRRSVRRVTALPLACRRLHLAGVADVVEFHADENGETPYPVEYKRGKPKLHRADEVQLCAQALCLEEMTGRTVPEGALFYGTTRRRAVVPFDSELRRLTEETAMSLRDLFQSGRIPPAVYRKDRCDACSLIEFCRPKTNGKSALRFRAGAIRDALAGDSGDAP
jgi:CRISPR-associated exonuclease Cas4